MADTIVPIVIVQHFDSVEEADEAREFLEDAGLHPLVVDEARQNGQGVFALQVPESELEQAESLLEDRVSSEEEGAMDTLSEWEEESDEVREAFEQD